MRSFTRLLLIISVASVAFSGRARAQTSDHTSAVRPHAYTGIGVQGSATFGRNGKITPGYPEVGLVIEGSPADTAGLKVGDVILEVNGKDFLKDPVHIGNPDVGQIFILRIRRNGVDHEITLVAAPRPPNLPPLKKSWDRKRKSGS